MTRAVHEQGTPIFLQLWHCGRASHSSFRQDRSLPVSCSAMKLHGDYIHTPAGTEPYETPRESRTDEIAGVVADCRRAAVISVKPKWDLDVHEPTRPRVLQALKLTCLTVIC